MTPSLFDLTGRLAVVVGGTSGIGHALALGLADAGADVVATGRRADAVDAVAGKIEQRGRRTLRHPVDVTSFPSLKALCDVCVNSFGKVDIVVAVAGVTKRVATLFVTPATATTMSTFPKVLRQASHSVLSDGKLVTSTG